MKKINIVKVFSNRFRMKSILVLSSIIAFTIIWSGRHRIPEDYYNNSTFEFSEITINNHYSENGWIRRDPSDIVYFNGKYRVYFNLAERPGGIRSNADWNGIIGQWVSDDTEIWNETEAVIFTGDDGAADEWGCVAPNVAVLKDTLWMVYDGWGAESGEDSTYAPNKITYFLSAYSIDGENFIKTNDTILARGGNECEFRVGDNTIVYFNDSIRIYHKSLKTRKEPSQMGMATSLSYGKPFSKHNNCSSVLPIGHENIVFKSGQYLVGIIPDTYDTGNTYIYISADGVNWELKAGPFNSYTQSPFAGGIFKDNSQFRKARSKPPDWGLCQQPDLNSNTRLNCLRKWKFNNNIK